MRAPLALLLLTISTASVPAMVIPEPCVVLAQARQQPLPVTEAEARSARRKVIALALAGDPLARACWHAIRQQGDRR